MRISRFFLPALISFLATSVHAADQQEFARILQLRLADLTAEASAALEKKYPEEDWGSYGFPEYIYSSESVETAYRIAVKEPQLLRPIPCYCFCEAMGHKNLLHCFLEDGRVGGSFDDHAVGCDICNAQAMLAFLWANAGASDEEILSGMERKFERLLQQNRAPHTGH